MKVFISWSGARSQKVALALKEWLPLVLQHIDPWMSEEDISAGSRWANSVAGELEEAQFGIVCLTQDNYQKEWILFEAGALSKSIDDSKVVPLLFDLEFSDLTGSPLSQFQAKMADKSGLKDIVGSINSSAGGTIKEVHLDRAFSSLWSQLESDFETIAKSPISAKPKQKQVEVLEQIVRQMSALESAYKEVATPRERRSLVAKVDRKSVELLRKSIEEKTHFGQYAGLLLYSSIFREEFPWIADLMRTSYVDLTSGNSDSFERGVVLLSALNDIFQKSDFTMELMQSSSRALKNMLHEVAGALESYHAHATLIGFVERT